MHMTKTGSALTNGLEVAVIGGSIAGCTAAIELARLGCSVTLLERTGEELKDRGAGIAVPPSVIETFVRRDLIDADFPHFPSHSIRRMWRTPAARQYGHVAWDQPMRVELLNWGGLYKSLRKRVPAGVYQAGRRVTALDAQRGDGRVGVTLADDTARGFDLVVCADGYTSLGRRTLFPDVAPQYAGYVLWRGSLPEPMLADPRPMESGISCLGYPGGHGIFYFVPNPEGTTAPGHRLVNWGLYLPIAASELPDFLTGTDGRRHEGSLPPGSMPLPTEQRLKQLARDRLPTYYADIVEQGRDTFAYAIYDCLVPAYARGRICLAGDAGAFARPHSAAGALKAMNDAVSLGDALRSATDLDEALAAWSSGRTETDNTLVQLGSQLGRALVTEIPDWSTMTAARMERWFKSIVTVSAEKFERAREPDPSPPRRGVAAAGT
jgi:2-polyprenyl-6-methoxyphenol hydroxylase-like FAD-dependent oxidoreductase